MIWNVQFTQFCLRLSSMETSTTPCVFNNEYQEFLKTFLNLLKIYGTFFVVVTKHEYSKKCLFKIKKLNESQFLKQFLKSVILSMPQFPPWQQDKLPPSQHHTTLAIWFHPWGGGGQILEHQGWSGSPSGSYGKDFSGNDQSYSCIDCLPIVCLHSDMFPQCQCQSNSNDIQHLETGLACK